VKKLFVIVIILGILVIGLILLTKNNSNSQKTNQPGFSIEGGNLSKAQNLSTVVLPHFDFAKDTRQKLIRELAKKIKPREIIILSVNHFSLGDSDILTTDKSWNFDKSNPKIDNILFNKIVEANIAKPFDNAFEGEHGIKNVLPDLSSEFKEAEYLPIIIKNGTSREKLDGLIKSLEANCHDCLLVSSIDFSHYNPDSLSQIHDQMSLAALSDKDSDKALLAETDSPEVFYMTIEWAKHKEFQQFTLSDWSNSSKDTNSPDRETTSYILGYYSNSKSEKKAEDTTTFLFAGDMMFDRMVNHQFKTGGLDHIFDNFGERVFWGTDIAFANLEGPISADPIDDNISANNLIFDFPPESIKALKSIRLNGVSLANNHTLNAGRGGLETTKGLLGRANIIHAGEQSKFSDESIIRYDSTIPVSIIVVNMLEDPGDDKIIEKIKSEKSASRFVIVFPHWGNEYDLKHSKSQENVAHKFIDAGCDLIVGSHPHVVQDVGIYRGKAIIYSLGNFVFDQTFSKDTQIGLILGGIISKTGVELSFFPTKQIKLKPEISSGDDKNKLLQRILPENSGYETVRDDTIKLIR